VSQIDEQILKENSRLSKDEPLLFADSLHVSICPGLQGSWQPLEDDFKIWRVKILSPGASSLNFGFTRYNMPSEGCLYLYSPDYSTIVGPFSDKDNAEHCQLWTPIISGEEVIIEVTLPKDKISDLELKIGFINRGFK